ncbi:MAG TPA: histidine kinase [Paenibacillus sp.]|uniref:cache domain-containing sensor histidine kinase n=1 Tax=Paenibacillus sp. TaxID=58172 RepID=UPI002BE9AFE7|nr:histidine kinase [Paenibacillus sp.]HUC91404.1 histidine kinase [Paenibacillus sp.]
MNPITGVKQFWQITFSSFRNKLMLGFLLVTIIPLLLIGVLSYTLSYSIARNGILDSVSYSSNRLNEALTNRFEQVENAADAMQYHMFTLVLQPSTTIAGQLEKYNQIKNNISNLSYTFNFVNISVYTKPEFIFSSQGINYFKLEELAKRGIDESFLLDNLNRLHWRLLTNQKEPDVLAVNKSTNIANYITAFSAFKKLNDQGLEYVYFIDINENEIAGLLRESTPDASVQSYIMDQDGRIISHMNRSMLGKTVDNSILAAVKGAAGKPVLFRDKRLIVNYNEITDWYVVTEVPNRYIRNNTSILVNILLMTSLLAILVAIVTSIFISNNLSTKIRRMARIMSSFTLKESNDRLMELHIPIRNERIYRDEFDRLALVFNTMIKKMNENFGKLLDMNLQEEKLRYQLLQAKINPHFLYNMLESIKTCQSLGRNDEANAMITRLAKFYRLILKKGDELISIKDELEIAVLYLEMEKLSHNHSFIWTIETDDQIEHFLIPKFTLQPLLENCIRHGLPGSGKRLEVGVSITYSDEDIRIEIRDNGVGIVPERLSRIRETLARESVDPDLFYGICNVNARLAVYGTNRSGLTIESEPNEGTTVTAAIQQMIPDEIIF